MLWATCCWWVAEPRHKRQKHDLARGCVIMHRCGSSSPRSRLHRFASHGRSSRGWARNHGARRTAVRSDSSSPTLPIRGSASGKLDVTTDDYLGISRGPGRVSPGRDRWLPRLSAAVRDSYRFNYQRPHVVSSMRPKRRNVERFVFASTYSNYGIAQDSLPVTEESSSIRSPCTPIEALRRTSPREARVRPRRRDPTFHDALRSLAPYAL